MTACHHSAPPAAAGQDATVFMALELSKAKWQLGVVLPGGAGKLSRYTIAGGDVAALAVRLAAARRAAEARVGGPVRVVGCYEAGYDGFWLHRWLVAQGVDNHVLDPASLPVDRRARRAKTDGLDLDALMRALLAHARGEPRVLRVVRVPTVAEEDAKRAHRERERLLQERLAHSNRIKGLLHGQGVRDADPFADDFTARLARLRTGDGRPLPPALVAELTREHERLALVVAQLTRIAAVPAPGAAPAAPKIAQLLRLRGIGPVSAGVLVNEVFYRAFDNRRQVGAYLGLTGTPHQSGASHREQGISKAGNRRARTLAIELAWLWLRHQPDSALSRWFHARVGTLKGRVRRISIVALARKLVVALWRYLETGLVPTGAVLRAGRG